MSTKSRIERLEQQSEHITVGRLGFVPVGREARKIYGDGEWGEDLVWFPEVEVDKIISEVYSMPVSELLTLLNTPYTPKADGSQDTAALIRRFCAAARSPHLPTCLPTATGKPPAEELSRPA